MSDSKKASKRATRRAFLKTMAAGSAAALAAPALALAAEAKAAAEPKDVSKAKAAGPPRTPEIEKSIEEQKGYLKQALEAIRGYELPVNSEQAFVFAPLETPRAERGR